MKELRPGTFEITLTERRTDRINVTYSFNESDFSSDEIKRIKYLLSKESLTPEEREELYNFCNKRSYDNEYEEDIFKRYEYDFEKLHSYSLGDFEDEQKQGGK